MSTELHTPAAVAAWLQQEATLCTRIDGAPALAVEHRGDLHHLPLKSAAAVAWTARAVAEVTGYPPARYIIRDALRLLALEAAIPAEPAWVFHSPRDAEQAVVLVRALRRIVPCGHHWHGTCRELAAALGPVPTSAPRAWHTSPHGLGRLLRRRAPMLAVFGLLLTFGTRHGHARDRLVTVTRGRPHEPLPT